MASWKVLPSSLKFVTLVTLGSAFFMKMSSLGMIEHRSVKSDVIASSMSFLSMHNHSEVTMTWDLTPFVFSIPEGALLVMFQPDKGTISPYPLTIPPENSTECEGLPCFKGRKVEKFYFDSRGVNKVVAE